MVMVKAPPSCRYGCTDQLKVGRHGCTQKQIGMQFLRRTTSSSCQLRSVRGEAVTAVAAGAGRTGWSLFLWSILPIIVTCAASVFGILGTLTAGTAPDWLIGAVAAGSPPWLLYSLVAAVALAVLLIAKAIRDFMFALSVRQARYDTVEELNDKLAPALNLMTDLAMLSPTAKKDKSALLRNIAHGCCSALVALAGTAGVRATVYALNPTDVEPIATFGRSDPPRKFLLNSAQGQEIEIYLQGNPQPELYPDTRKDSPDHFESSSGRYRTFLRVPIYADGFSFGMVTVDARQNKSLKKHDLRVAELVAAALGTAFAIAAD